MNTIDERWQAIAQKRDANAAELLKTLIHREWRRVLRELQALDIDSGDVAGAANLIGQYRVLDKLMAALSEGSLGSDYEIEAEWRLKLVEQIVEAFELNKTPPSPPRRYQSLAQQLAAACGLEVIRE